jgi:hypothetical protein
MCVCVCVREREAQMDMEKQGDRDRKRHIDKGRQADRCTSVQRKSGGDIEPDRQRSRKTDVQAG